MADSTTTVGSDLTGGGDADTTGGGGSESTGGGGVDTRQKFILVADLGTSTIRSHVYNKAAQLVAQAEEQTTLVYPEVGAVEVDPDQLWTTFVSVIKQALHSGDLQASDIVCMGITAFRNSFLMWDRETGQAFGNINTWQDKRTKDLVKSWNNSMTLAAMNKGSGFLHVITGSPRFKAGHALKFMTQAVPLRLKWVLDNNEKLRMRVKQQQVMFGTLDTWLLWKLTGGEVWVTDRSSASATLMYDTFQNKWSSLICNLVGIPLHILPEIVDTTGVLGKCDPSIFGSTISITASIADQQASLFGHCCFSPGDIKLTLGTGSFLDVNIGAMPLALITGIYPLVAWDISHKITFLAEASTLTIGTCVDWLTNIGVIPDVSSSSDIAKSVSDTNGCYFVPAFCGLAAPINDDKAGGLLIGLTPTVTAAHITRAVLESMAFVIKLQYETMLAECGQTVSHIRVDGGVANNDFLLQCLADILQKPIHRPHTVNMTSRGAAFLAGIGAGIWTSLEELKSLAPEKTIFQPQDTWSYYKRAITSWERAVRRSKGWVTD